MACNEFPFNRVCLAKFCTLYQAQHPYFTSNYTSTRYEGDSNPTSAVAKRLTMDAEKCWNLLIFRKSKTSFSHFIDEHAVVFVLSTHIHKSYDLDTGFKLEIDLRV